MNVFENWLSIVEGEVNERLFKEGFVHIKVPYTNDESLKTSMLYISQILGEVVESYGGDVIRIIKPKSNPLDYQPAQRADSLDLHTDGSSYSTVPNILIMGMAHKASDGGESVLRDGVHIMQDIYNYYGNIPPSLTNQPCIDIFDNGEKIGKKRTVLEEVWNKFLMRYRKDLDLGTDVVNLENIFQWGRRRFLDIGTGEILVVDNSRMLHGRTNFTDTRRKLFRLWVSAYSNEALWILK